jgi:hypothetical protein
MKAGTFVRQISNCGVTRELQSAWKQAALDGAEGEK